MNNYYLNKRRLKIEILDSNYKWFDAGTHELLFESSIYIKNIEDSKKKMISCIEEIAYNNNLIDKDKLTL